MSKLSCSLLLLLFLMGCGGAPDQHQSAEHSQQQIYFCPMHPAIRSAKPGFCPICGMPLQLESGSHEPHSSDLPERATFELSPHEQELIGAVTAPVTLEDSVLLIKTYGRVFSDPDLYAALSEYRNTLGLGEQIQQAAKLKLRRLGLLAEELLPLVRDDKALQAILLPNEKAWIAIEIYESDYPLVAKDQTVVLQSMALPELKLRAKLASISPVINTTTRTARALALVDNSKGELKADMTLSAELQVARGQKVLIPEGALLRSENLDYVFVLQGDNTIIPRQIKVGYKSGARYEVSAGLQSGERVVSSANFLVDSESRLKHVLSLGSTSTQSASPHQH